MKLASLKLYRVAVPLKKVIRHASHERSTSENLVVRVTLASGQTGYGEGVPRSYVTGETLDSTFEFLANHDWSRQIGKPADFATLVQTLSTLTIPENLDDPRGMAGNAARSALELALLDAYGQHFGESVGRVIEVAPFPGLRIHSKPQPVRYSGAITAESSFDEWKSAIKMRLYGFRQVKIKVGTAGQDDPSRLKRLRRVLGRRMDLRLDANEAWNASELLDKVEPLRPYRPTALEQPVPHAQVNELADLRPKLGIPIMLDESLCGFPDAQAAIAHQTADILNVRISKCGGILPSLKIIALAQNAGLKVQLGCHPGETSLLSAAGRHVASRVEGLRYVEGSYDRHILARNLTTNDLTFRYGGWAPPLVGPGLGVTVDPAALEAMTTDSREFHYD